MSRISGLVTAYVTPNEANCLGEMLKAVKLAGWSQACSDSDSWTAGWTGWSQPNLASNERWTVVMDGCLFNRDELAGGDCDAERILHQVEQDGVVNAMKRLNGDFAIALQDKRTKAVWLVRDRIGAKPLFYVESRDRLAFASRTRSLLMLPDVSTNVNERFAATFAGSHYRYFDNDPNASPFADIRQLPAGSLLKWEPNKDATIERYWSLTDQPNWEEGEEELADQYRELLLDAVRRRFEVADRPGFTLSGGMDSSSVLACAVRASGEKQHAFSTVYEDKTYDESEEIQSMLEATVTQWHKVPLDRPDVISTVEQMVACHDEPVATATWLSHYQLCGQATTEGFGSLFGGLGGDELNAGEYEYFLYHFADMVAGGQADQLDAEIEKWIEYHDHPIFKKSHEMAHRELAKIQANGRPFHCVPELSRLNRYVDTVSKDYHRLDQFTPVMEHPFSSYLKNRTFQDMFRETAPCCLRAEERQATALGLENYLPFFDHRLIEFMFRVPGSMKIRDGVTKVLLRRAMADILPEETRSRIAKTGWNAPAHVWFSGPGIEPLMDVVRSQSFRERGIYDLDRVGQIIEEHQDIVEHGKLQENHMMFLWQLVNLELWLRDVDQLSTRKATLGLNPVS